MLSVVGGLPLNSTVCLLPEVGGARVEMDEVCPAPVKWVVIAPQMSHGLGDVKVAIEIYRLVKEAFARFGVKLLNHANLQPKYDVFLKGDFADFVPLVNGMPPPADLTVVFPVFLKGIEDLIPALMASDRRYMMIADYGFESHTRDIQRLQSSRSKLSWHAFGLGKESLGVIFNRELYQTFLEDLPDAVKVTRFVPKLPKKMRETVMRGQSVAEFGQEWDLHLGYSASGAAKVLFVKSVTRLMKNNPIKKKLCFVLVGKEIDHEISPLKDVLKREGVGHIEYFSAPSEDTEPKKVVDVRANQEGTTVVIYCVPKLSETTMTTMRQASKKETLVTGTQSLIEAITLGQYPLYEKLSHVNDFIFDLSFEALMNEPEVGLFFEEFLNKFPLTQHRFEGGVIEQSYHEDDVRAATGAFKKLSHLKLQYRRFISTFYQKWDFGPRIRSIIKGYLGT